MLVLCVLALTIRLVYLVDSHDEPTFSRPIVDAAVYDGMAQQIAAGTYRTNTPFYHPPLFPYLLAVIYRFSGNSMLAAKLVLALIGALTVMLTALTARRLMGWGPSWIAGIMAAVCGPLIFYDSQFLPAGLATMLNILCLWLLLMASSSGAPLLWLAAGVVLGLAADAVPNILSFVPFVLAWLLWKRSAGRLRSTLVVPALLLCSGVAIAVLPVTLANYRNSGQRCLISYNGGLNFYIGNNLKADETIALRPSYGWENLDKLPMRNGALKAVDQDRFYVALTLAYVREHPGQFVRDLLKKARQITNARELPRNVDIYIFREWSAILSATVWQVGPFGFPFGLIFPLACLGMIIACRRRPDSGLLAIYLGVYSVSIIASFVTSRYRVVLLPALIIFAAHAMVWLWQSRRDFRRLAPAAVLVLMAGIWSNTAVSAPTDGIPFAAEVYNLLALQSAREHDYVRAGADADAAIARSPGYAEAQRSRGVIYMMQGNLPAARDFLQKAVTLKPGYAEAHDDLGNVLERLGDASGAEAAYRAVIQHSPETARGFTDLGTLLFRQGRVAEAVPVLRTAIAVDLTAYPAYGLLAWIMATCPDATFRNGPQAVEYATYLIRDRQQISPQWLDALAAAHAESGSFPQALAVQERAIQVWRASGREDAAQQGELRLVMYRRAQPFRDLSLAPIR
jgi:Tfp pilus assembly protein PilF